MKRLRAPLFLFAFLLAGLHLRRERVERRSRGDTTISTARKLRAVTHDLVHRDGALDHALTLAFDIDLTETTVVELAPEIVLTGGPIAFDALERPVAIEAHLRGSRAIVSFPPPPPAFGAVRQVTIAFSTASPPPTYGWSHRAVALPWASSLAPPRVPLRVQAHLEGATSAPGWRCSEDNVGHVCAIEAGRRRTQLAVPIERLDDTREKLGFVLLVAVVISALMAAIYRRWTSLAARMGVRDEVTDPSLVEFVERARKEYRTHRAPNAQRATRPSLDEVDPLEAVALIARGIAAVLGLLASVFLVAQLEGGFLPFVAPLALALWAALAGLTIIVAVGYAEPRPWAAIALLTVLGGLAFHPLLRWMLPGIPPLAAAVLMQLTGRR